MVADIPILLDEHAGSGESPEVSPFLTLEHSPQLLVVNFVDVVLCKPRFPFKLDDNY